MTWYAITTEPHRLRAVRLVLRRRGQEAYLPAQVMRRPGRKKRSIAPLMPYIFVKAPAPELLSLWMYDITQTRHVRGFVSLTTDKFPAAIQDEKIQNLRVHVAGLQRLARAARWKRRLRKGGQAVITSGHFVGKRGTVTWMRGNRAKLEAFIFGSTREIAIAVKDLEAAA